MKAIVKLDKSPGLNLVEKAIPKVSEDGVLIKVNKSAICGTDLHIYHWDAWAAAEVKVTPRIIGHEFVGSVVEVGSRVKFIREGMRVSAEGHIACQYCRNCRTSNAHVCLNMLGVGRKFDGCFAEYIVVPERNVWPLDSEIKDEVAACFDPLGNAVYATLSQQIAAQSVLITGAGPVGCMAAAVAKKAGALKVIVTDLSDYRLGLATSLGVNRAVNIVKKDSLKKVMEEEGIYDGFDVGLEMSGSPKALNDMIKFMRPTGCISLMGILPKDIGVDWTTVIFNEITLRGFHGRRIFDTWYQVTNLVKTGLDIEPLITHRFHYTEFEQAFSLMHSGMSGKIILEWN